MTQINDRDNAYIVARGVLSRGPEDQKALILSDPKDIELVLSALSACSPTGGGSNEFSLLRRLQLMTGRGPNDTLVERYCTNIVNEYKECIEG